MAEIGAAFPRRTPGRRAYETRKGGEAGFGARFRKPLVAATLISGDVVASPAAVSFSGALMQLAGLQPAYAGNVVVPLLILVLMFFAAGLYAGSGPSPYERFRLRAHCIAGFAAIDLLLGFPAGLSGHLIAAEAGKAICLLLFGHYLEALLRSILIRVDLWGAPTAVVGCGESSRKLAHLLMRQPDLGLEPVGFIETGNSQEAQLPLPLIEDPGGLRSRVEVVIFTSADELAAFTSDPRPWMPSCRLLLVEDAHDIQSLWLHTRMLGAAIGIEIRRDLCLRHNRLLKRAIDLLLAAPMALLAGPVIAALALAVKLVDPGPAFYVQERIGRSGAALRIVKLRTMYADAERRLEELLSRDPQARAEWLRFFKLDRDPRILPIVGSFMRRASLDELPQLWNVIRGDMSLVGPRPFPSYHMNGFDAEFRAIRVSVQPGLTGAWQISSRSDGDLQVQKAQDLFYIRNWSIWLDVYILLQTLPAVLRANGAK